MLICFPLAERTLVWSEAISNAQQSDHRWFWAHFGLIRGNFERTSVWSEAFSSARQSGQRHIWAHNSLIWGDIRARNSLIRGSFRTHFKRTRISERTIVWAEEKSVWVGLIRGHFRLGWSDQRPFWPGPQPGLACSESVWEIVIRSGNRVWVISEVKKKLEIEKWVQPDCSQRHSHQVQN